MQKIAQLFQLHRLDFPNKIKILNYILKRVLHFKTTTAERDLYKYYIHLIEADGVLAKENAGSFVSKYKKSNETLLLRKKPSSDLDVFNQVNKHHEYKLLVELYMDNFPNRRGLNIIDAGSNIGLTSVYFSRYFPESNFIVIEPDSSNFESINFNLEANGVKNVVKVKGGLWSKNTNLKIVNDFRDKKEWAIRVEETKEEADLKAFSVNYLVKENDFDFIDILKIDIEGSEKEVFTGAEADVSFLDKTRCIAIEIHDEFDCRAQINDILTRFDFKFFESGELTIGINQNLLQTV